MGGRWHWTATSVSATCTRRGCMSGATVRAQETMAQARASRAGAVKVKDRPHVSNEATLRRLGQRWECGRVSGPWPKSECRGRWCAGLSAVNGPERTSLKLSVKLSETRWTSGCDSSSWSVRLASAAAASASRCCCAASPECRATSGTSVACEGPAAAKTASSSSMELMRLHGVKRDDQVTAKLIHTKSDHHVDHIPNILRDLLSAAKPFFKKNTRKGAQTARLVGALGALQPSWPSWLGALPPAYPKVVPRHCPGENLR